MKQFGQELGARLHGGEVIELVGDIGSGKTTLVKGMAVGLGATEDVQSPSFTISRVYQARDGLELHHYDFYRLYDAGIMANEIAETVRDPKVITVIEWAGVVEGTLPKNRLAITITSPTETTRRLAIDGATDLVEGL